MERPAVATRPPTDAAIQIRGLVKEYGGPAGVRAVDDIDLDVGADEIFGLLGPNGAGKSTTIGVCTTRVVATSGTVRVHGIDVREDPARVKRAIGVVTQQNTLDRSCTVFENVYFHVRYFGTARAAARRRAGEVLSQFRLDDRSGSMPDELSGGMAQRLQLARAVSHRPNILVLDEPTAGLDPQSRLALWAIVRRVRKGGAAVLITTHNMDEADELCDRVAIMDRGRILACDRPETLKEGTGVATVIELRTDGPRDPLAAALRALPGIRTVEESRQGLRVLATERDGVLEHVVEAARGRGVHDISVRRPSLETVFIDLTGRALRD